MAFFCLNVTYPPPKGSLASKVIYICNLRSSTTYSCSRNWPGCSLDLRYVVLLCCFLPRRVEASFARSSPVGARLAWTQSKYRTHHQETAALGQQAKISGRYAYIPKRASTLRQQASNVSFVSPHVDGSTSASTSSVKNQGIGRISDERKISVSWK